MTVLLRNGTTVEDHRLDRLPSETTEHLERYPLTAATMPSQDTPILGGFNWFSNCFDPTYTRIRGHAYAILPGPQNLGRLVGGHAIAFPPWGTTDPISWWIYYNQLKEGRCAEFAGLRCLSLSNREQYDIASRWHYFEAQRNDEWAGGSYPGAAPQYEGTSVRAILDVFRTYGAIPKRGTSPDPARGIAAYRWVTNWDDARKVTGTPDWMPGLIYLQSWGRDHPHRTVMPDETGERLLSEFGEMGVVTDR